jgi:serpin B
MTTRLAFLSAALAGVLSLVPRAPAQEIPAEDIAAVVAGNNQFAIDLYRQLSAQTEDDIFFSPLSVSTAMAMAYGGARGQTADEMAGVLHFTLPQDRFHAAAGGLLADLTGHTRPEYQLDVANRLWGQEGFPFRSAFIDVTQEHYGAGLEELDFMNQPEPSRVTINAWVEDQTQGRIRDLLPQGAITADTRLVLTNTIYFLGDWTKPFSSDDTISGIFHSSASQAVEIPMIRQRETFAYAETPDFQLLEMDYKGDDLSMLILLPQTADGLDEIAAGLTMDEIEDAIDQLAMTEVMVTFPKYGTTSEFSLKDALRDLGMPTAFSDLADFSGIADVPLLISDVVHKAYLNVNEKGTEAGAATGVIFEPTSAPPIFTADHPFLFLIRDNVTESILFLGRVVSPLPPAAAAVPEPASRAIAIVMLVAVVGFARVRTRGVRGK